MSASTSSNWRTNYEPHEDQDDYRKGQDSQFCEVSHAAPGLGRVALLSGFDNRGFLAVAARQRKGYENR